MHFGFLPWVHLPHLVPMFRICRSLTRLGHLVTIFGVDDSEKALGNQLAVFGLSGRAKIFSDQALLMSKDWLAQQQRDLGLDVLFLDAVHQSASYTFLEAGMRHMVILHAGLPDFRSSDMPTWHFVHPAHSRFRWLTSRCMQEMAERLRRRFAPGVGDMAKAYGATVDSRRVWGFGCTEFRHVPAIRAMSLCPALEFPKERGRVSYLGTVLPTPDDVDWRPIPEELSNNSQPLIVCAFGTTGLFSEEYDWLVILAEKVARSFPRHQVVAVVNRQTMSTLGANTGLRNLSFHTWIPLWELLSTRRADKVVVSSAGVGAFREAMASQTPMVAIPRRLDQFGVAARVAYFGVGSALISRRLPFPDLVVKCVANVLADAEVHRRSQRVFQETLEFEATQPLRKFCDGLVGH